MKRKKWSLAKVSGKSLGVLCVGVLFAWLFLSVCLPSLAVAGRPRRFMAIGTVFGAGLSLGSPRWPLPIRSFALSEPDPYVLELPTLELRFFLESRHSIDVTFSLVNMLSTLSSSVLAASVGVFYNFNIPRYELRYIVAPGLEIAGSQTGARLFASMRLGCEWLDMENRFGFTIMLRPFVGWGNDRLAGIGPGGGTTAQATHYVQYGAFVEFGFLFFLFPPAGKR